MSLQPDCGTCKSPLRPPGRSQPQAGALPAGAVLPKSLLDKMARAPIVALAVCAVVVAVLPTVHSQRIMDARLKCSACRAVAVSCAAAAVAGTRLSGGRVPMPQSKRTPAPCLRIMSCRRCCPSGWRRRFPATTWTSGTVSTRQAKNSTAGCCFHSLSCGRACTGCRGLRWCRRECGGGAGGGGFAACCWAARRVRRPAEAAPLPLHLSHRKANAGAK